MKKKKALVFGITGQDGSYLAELLLNKNYLVYGVKRRTSLIHTTRIDHIYKDFHLKTNLILKYGDVTDFSNVFRLINEIKPDEIYNLAAQSNVGVSFELAELSLWLGPYQLIKEGKPLSFIKEEVSLYIQNRINGTYLVDDSVIIRLVMGKGKSEGIAWGCDLSAQYVRINADYTT